MDDEKLLMHFGQKVRDFRKQNGLTMQQLAEDLGISTNHLGRIERGTSNTTITNFYRMATILDIPSHLVDEMKQVVQKQEE
ncbi:helix-turn-helix domain-containing protein [Lentibacillus jeotgali]|uniref:helix-turn-helix domain-containing protein n=1 Tax=Lentibacillus jeotgali TaxID=558169 RepID=UPI00026287DB|nr:helix-turn-helix transcriptional regulator [Lentibacillus jeotgali]